jgi:hypothetical protein
VHPPKRSNAAEVFPLTQLPRELAPLLSQPPPTYRRCYYLVLDGRLPAEKPGREYEIRRVNLPDIARLFAALPNTETLPLVQLAPRRHPARTVRREKSPASAACNLPAVA